MMTSIYAKLIGAGLVLALLTGILGYGYHLGATHVQAKWDADTQARNIVLAQAQAKSAQITTQVVTKYVDRVQVVHDRAAIIVKKVPVYVTAKADAACTVPVGFVRLYNAAVQGSELTATAGGSNDAPSGVALSQIASVDASNLGVSRANAEQLKALQDWVRQQAAMQ